MSGPTVVVVGGRQLARMLAQAASALDVELRILVSPTDAAVTALSPCVDIVDHRYLRPTRSVTPGRPSSPSASRLLIPTARTPTTCRRPLKPLRRTLPC